MVCIRSSESVSIAWYSIFTSTSLVTKMVEFPVIAGGVFAIDKKDTCREIIPLCMTVTTGLIVMVVVSIIGLSVISSALYGHFSQ